MNRLMLESAMDNEPGFRKGLRCPRCSQYVPDQDLNFCPACGLRLSFPESGAHNNAPLPEDPSPSDLASDSDRVDFIPGHSLAGFWLRLGAFWLDTLIILLMATFIGSLTYSTAIGRQLFPNLKKIILFMILLFIFYHSLLLGKNRATPGKKFFGLTVIPHAPPFRFGYTEAIFRAMSYFFSFLFLGLGFISIAFNKYKQGWHDKLSNTLVIKIRKVSIPKKALGLFALTLLVFMLFALQFNLTRVYHSVFRPQQSMHGRYGREVVSLLVTKSEIRNGDYKEIHTRSGSHKIRLPQSAQDGDLFMVERDEEEGGPFYIKIIIIELI